MKKQEKRWDPAREYNPETADIDTWAPSTIIRYRAREVRKVADAIEVAAPQLEAGAAAITSALRDGRTVVTVGAGGSGVAGMSVMREIVQNHRDLDPGHVTYRVAGGAEIFQPLGREDLEDSWDEGVREADDLGLQKGDVVVCISATGRTPYTRGTAKRALELGATTIGLVCTTPTELENEVDLPIVLEIGPEMFVGATCEKAALAQAAALDAVMDITVVALGITEGNICRARLCHDKARIREQAFAGARKRAAFFRRERGRAGG